MTKRLFEAAMHVGDIVLTTDRRSLVSALIRTATGAEFSHAAIYVGGRLIEARGMGVASVSLDSMYIEDSRNVAVLRHRDREGARRAAQRAHEFLGRRYHYMGALLSAVRRRPWILMPATFCSALVGGAYQRAGIELFDGVDPHTASPGDFLRSRHLADVTHDVVREMSEARCAGQAIDAGAANKYSEVILGAQHRTFSRSLNLVLKALGHDHDSIEGAILTIHNSSGWRQFVKDRVLYGAVRVGGLEGAWDSVLQDVQIMIDGVDLSKVMASIDPSESTWPICTAAELRKIRECRDMTAQLIQTDELRESYVMSLHAQGDESLLCLLALRRVLASRRARAVELLAKIDGMLRDIEHLL